MGRFLLIGLDGAEPSLIERWLEEGRLPALARIRDSGSLLRCASTVPHATFPAWTSCVTGVNSGKHGVFDFTRMVEGEYAIRFANATARQTAAIWNVLSDAGKRVCVLGVPATYPPEDINGVMVSGFDSPVCTSVDASFVTPRSEFATVKEWRFADFQESAIGPGWHDMALKKLLEGIQTKERIATELLQREPWDFFMMVFGESDTVSHHFWMFHDEKSPRHRPGHETAIRQIYERLDEAVGNLVSAAGEDVVVGIVSDHGFGGAGTGVVHLNNWLAEQGHLSFSPSRESVLKKLALTATPEAWRGALFRRLEGLASRAESHSRFAGIDWGATRAWSEELNYFPSIRINLRGREPDGQVAPADYTAYCSDLCAQLKSWAPIANAWPRDELYDGPCMNRAPDIILELALENGYSHTCLRARGGPSFRRIAAEEHLGGKERGMNGNHRPIGTLMLSKSTDAESATLLDVAPTVYAALGVPGPQMDGHSLLGTGETKPNTTAPHTQSEYSSEQESVVEERLRKLGYFE